MTKEYNNAWYAKHKDRIREKKNSNTKKYRIEKRQFIIDLLKKSKCKHCGIDDWRVLEFDHRDPKEKKFNIADGPNQAFDKLKEEISKCIVLCSNCHRKVHNNIIQIPKAGVVTNLQNCDLEDRSL